MLLVFLFISGFGFWQLGTQKRAARILALIPKEHAPSDTSDKSNTNSDDELPPTPTLSSIASSPPRSIDSSLERRIYSVIPKMTKSHVNLKLLILLDNITSRIHMKTLDWHPFFKIYAHCLLRSLIMIIFHHFLQYRHYRLHQQLLKYTRKEKQGGTLFFCGNVVSYVIITNRSGQSWFLHRRLLGILFFRPCFSFIITNRTCQKNTTVYCAKCNLRLCFVIGKNCRNCFFNFHVK